MFRLPSGIKINNLIDDLRVFSWEASDILLFYSNKIKEPYLGDKLIQNDDIKDPVTKADLEVNEIILKRIKENYIDVEWGFLSEENAKLDIQPIKINSDWLWVLDPLDGTKDFIQGTGEYAMHLALNYKNKPLIGVVLIPEKDELWIYDGNNVWCESRKQPIKQPKLSDTKEISNMKIVRSRNHNNTYLEHLIRKLNFECSIEMGSVGCKIASILRGESDIYISLSIPGKSSPKDWDFAAPAAILNAAGGAITNLDNRRLIFNKNNFRQEGIIVATNSSKNHENICNHIKDVMKIYDICPELV